MAIGGPDDVLVSATTAELLEGSGVRLDDFGAHMLKGLDRPRQLFRLSASTGAAARS